MRDRQAKQALGILVLGRCVSLDGYIHGVSMPSGFEEFNRRRLAALRGAGTLQLFKFLLITLCCAVFLGLVVLRG